MSEIALGTGNYTRRKKPMLPVVIDDYDDLLRFLRKNTVQLAFTRDEWMAKPKEERERVKATFNWIVGGKVNGTRNNANTEYRCLLTLDLERKKDQEERLPVWAKLRAQVKRAQCGVVLAKSTGYTDADPRARVYVLLDKPLQGPHAKRALKHLTRLVAQRLGVGAWLRPESWTWSSPMVLPVDFAEPKGEELVGAGGDSGLTLFAGPPLDVDAALREVALEMADTPVLWDSDTEEDPVFKALADAGLNPRRNEEDAVFFVCPFDHEHGKPTAQDPQSTQTAYWPNYHGRPLVRCLDTEPGDDHLTYTKLVEWLRDEGHLDQRPIQVPTGATEHDLASLFEQFMEGTFYFEHVVGAVPRPLQYHEARGWQACKQGEHFDFLRNTVIPWLGKQLAAIPVDTPLYEKIARLHGLAGRVSSVRAALTFAATAERLRTLPDQWDADPWLLGCPNGLVELRTGAFRPYTPADKLLRRTNANWDPSAPEPTLFLNLVEHLAPEAAAYLQRFAGHALVGKLLHERMLFIYGLEDDLRNGDNGKTTFANALADVLGSYYAMADSALLAETQFQKSSGSATTDINALIGARLALLNETDKSMVLSAVKLKRLVSVSDIAHRKMYAEQEQSRITAKLLVTTNRRPTVTDTDQGTWRRIAALPPQPPIPKDQRDPHYGEKLVAERDGILQWMYAGLRAVLADTSPDPMTPIGAVAQEVEEWRYGQDLFGQWAAEHLELGPTHRATRQRVYASYRDWCAANEHACPSEPQFRGELLSRFQTVTSPQGKKKAAGVMARIYVGVRLV